MCVGGGVVNHGLVFVGHGDILVGEGPAVGFYTSLGGGGGGVGVEVVGVGEVGGGDGGAGGGGTVVEHQVVDVVDAVVARLAGGEDVAEGYVPSVAGVGGEVDGDMLVVCRRRS